MLVPALAWACLPTYSGWAQSDEGATTTTTAGSADLSSFSVSGGTPGSWVQAALARHQSLIAARVTAARNGEAAGVRSEDVGEETGDTSSTTDALSSLSDLSTLFGQYSDSLGSLDSLSGLLALLTASSSDGTATTTTTSKSGDTQSSLAGVETPALSTGVAGAGGETSNGTGWSDGILGAVLNGFGLTSEPTDFIEAFKSLLEPLVLPPAESPSDVGEHP
jgi:hypothetical protein